MRQTKWDGEVWTINGQGYFAIGGRKLHRSKWEKLRGPIPKGYVVHHKDHNKINNRISNLECMSHAEHTRHHMNEHIHSVAGRKRGAKVLALTALERGKKISESRLAIKKTLRPCKQCTKQFWSRLPQARLCSTRCRGNFYYQSGRYDETRLCPICSASYTCSKFDDQASCSKTCGQELARRKRAS